MSSSSDGSSNRKAASLMSAEERTVPKSLRSMEPDLVVVVGGVEFYHYQFDLCKDCTMIDTMLAANMKESEEKKIEFPDRDPDLWLDVYKFMDPATKDEDFEALFRDLCIDNDGLFDYETCAELVSWLDFLGMQSVVEKMDKLAAKLCLEEYNDKEVYQDYESWCLWKQSSCPLTQRAVKEVLKHLLEDHAYYLSRGLGWTIKEDMAEHFKGYLLDDQCGDEIWSYLLSKVDFPESMLEQGRKVIVESPLFPGILDFAGRSMKKEPPEKLILSFEEED